MLLIDCATRAVKAQQARARIKRSGFTPNGHMLWTDREKKIVRDLAPDYDAILRKLKNRSRPAIKAQAGKMGLWKKNHHWSGADIVRLKRLYPRSPRNDICATFPHSKWKNISRAANYHRAPHRILPYKPTGVGPIDQLLVKCRKSNINLVELDKMCGTGRYFQRHSWRHWRPDYRHFTKAFELFGGELQVRWKEEYEA